MYQRILVPLDGSPVAEAALEVASRILSPHQGELVLVRMQEYSKEARSSEFAVVAEAFEAERARCENYLTLVAERWRKPDRKVSLRVLPHQLRSAQMLSQAAESGDCDLVVLTSHGRTGLERVLIGSVAEEMARICSVPVLILGPQTAEVRLVKDQLRAMIEPAQGGAR